MSISKSFHAHYQSLKCKHVKTVPTALDTFNGGKAVSVRKGHPGNPQKQKRFQYIRTASLRPRTEKTTATTTQRIAYPDVE